ncbi:hypothetical protein XSR1_10061 [Xenorhabdus szentirmaii DSM 16338]|uniref:Uncharacterized protein n=1 Tax=Xenorhabdus szentirmaii DSM 16338 TaxID=1427518 RepID=W1ISH8_9GAMM|nr:hypothetical protein XSR1_10061 [Xenorhabdus szentirmaii DSM 16338]
MHTDNQGHCGSDFIFVWLGSHNLYYVKYELLDNKFTSVLHTAKP